MGPFVRDPFFNLTVKKDLVWITEKDFNKQKDQGKLKDRMDGPVAWSRTPRLVIISRQISKETPLWEKYHNLAYKKEEKKLLQLSLFYMDKLGDGGAPPKALIIQRFKNITQDKIPKIEIETIDRPTRDKLDLVCGGQTESQKDIEKSILNLILIEITKKHQGRSDLLEVMAKEYGITSESKIDRAIKKAKNYKNKEGKKAPLIKSGGSGSSQGYSPTAETKKFLSMEKD